MTLTQILRSEKEELAMKEIMTVTAPVIRTGRIREKRNNENHEILIIDSVTEIGAKQR